MLGVYWALTISSCLPSCLPEEILPLISSMSQGQCRGPCLYLGGRDSKWKQTGQLGSISKKRDPGCLVDSSSVTCRWLRNAGSEFPGMESPIHILICLFSQQVLFICCPPAQPASYWVIYKWSDRQNLAQGQEYKEDVVGQPEGGMERLAKRPAIGRWRPRQ